MNTIENKIPRQCKYCGYDGKVVKENPMGSLSYPSGKNKMLLFDYKHCYVCNICRRKLPLRVKRALIKAKYAQ